MKNSRINRRCNVNSGWLLIVCALLGIVTIIAPSRATAQISAAGVNGAVHDTTGAVVPQTAVKLTEVDTNVSRDTRTGRSGDYFFNGIPPGRYTVTFTAPQFRVTTVQPFDVGVDQVITINGKMEVGAVGETVTVQAEGAQVDSSTAELGTIISNQSIENLPLNGRNFTEMLDLVPGATPISTGQAAGGSNDTGMISSTASTAYSFPSVNGAFNRSNLFLTDGMNNNAAFYNTYAVSPIIDALDQFKVNSHNQAQFGGVLGGVINVSTKSGTNVMHGSAWEYWRGGTFDAKPYFVSVVPPAFHFHQFGGQVGGPVIIPHLYNGKNKTFFELAYEGTHFTKSNTTNIRLPTAAQLGETTFGGPVTLPFADFSSASTGVTKNGNCNASDTTIDVGACQLWDPTVGNFASPKPYRTAYIGDQVPTSEFKPTQIALINELFKGVQPTTIPGQATTTANYQITAPITQPTYNYMIRIDQHIGDRDFIFARFSDWQERITTPSSLPGLYAFTQFPSQDYGVSWTHVLNPSTTVQVEYSRSHVNRTTATKFDDTSLAQTYGCSASLCSSYVQHITLFPIENITSGFSGGETVSDGVNLSSVHEWGGTVNRVIGRHSLQAGASWDEMNYTGYTENTTLTFTGAATGNFNANPSSPATITATQLAAQTGFGLLDFLLDYPSSAAYRNVYSTERPGGILSLYLQDNWKASSKLTLDYGLRYDRGVLPQYGVDGTQNVNGGIVTGDYDFNTGNYILQALPQLCSVTGRSPCLPSATLPAHVVVAQNEHIMHGSKMNFGPRFGFAFAANPKTAIRGAFGIYWDNWSALLQMPQNFQGLWPDTGTQTISTANTPVAGGTYVSAQNPFASTGGNLPAATPFTTSNVGVTVDPFWKNPYSEQYNIGVEQEFPLRIIMALNYVGSESHRLDIGGYYNTGTPCGNPCPYASFNARVAAGASGQPFPYAAPQSSWDHSGANANYNGLQASLKGNAIANDLTFLLSYTWSKAIDEGTDGFFGAEGGVPQDPYNVRTSRGRAGFNVPQSFVTSYVYQLPIGRGHLLATGNRYADAVIGGWKWSGILRGRSGQGFQVTAAGDVALTGNGGTYERANQVGDPFVPGTVPGNPGCTGSTVVHNRFAWFNPCAFTVPLLGTYGNSQRYAFNGPDYWSYNAGLQRIFQLDKLSFSLQVQAFNALNHPSLGLPATNVSAASNFGIITSTASTQRQVQFSGKLSF